MTYRDPREALQAENDCLRQELKDAQEELASARATPDGHEHERRRWALGMRCLGGLAMMAPFLAMMSLCEHRAMHRAAWQSSMLTMPPAVPSVAHSGCRMATLPTGFEHFTQSIERSARVVEATSLPGISAGDACTVRIAPVSMLEFNCHVDVVCGGRTVYGALPTGYAHCDVDQARVTRAFDPDPSALDGDAAITADFTTHSVVIEDRVGGSPSRLALRLDQPPATR